MAEYNPSKIIKDGNTYNFRDNTKIPLAGSNQISGSLIPATDNSIDVGSSTKNIKMLYTKGITIDGTQFLPSNYIPMSGGSVISGREYRRTVDDSYLLFAGGSAYNLGAYLTLYGKNNPDAPGQIILSCRQPDGTAVALNLQPNGTATWNGKNLAMQEDVVPRSGGAVMTGTLLGRTVSNTYFQICGGANWTDGGTVGASAKNRTGWAGEGAVYLHPSNGSIEKEMLLYFNGTWTWNGTACQITSDQRYKQQINAIDDKLLDAWEDVELSQFKYNDAVEQKGNTARLHTGYVVQQIDDACKSHGVDISKYGLYCHEEYAEETREVEQADGTKKTEVVRPANEHYSLRYTEALIVECAYLRKCIKELRNEIEELKKGNNVK